MVVKLICVHGGRHLGLGDGSGFEEEWQKSKAAYICKYSYSIMDLDFIFRRIIVVAYFVSNFVAMTTGSAVVEFD